MLKKIIALFGLLLFLVGLTVVLTLLAGGRQARAKDDAAVSDLGPVDFNCQEIIHDVIFERRIMTEQESQSLTLVLFNDLGTDTCSTAVTLLAPNFTITPPAVSRPVAVEPGESLRLVWVLSPQKTGSFDIVVAAGSQSQTIGVNVTTVLGFTAVQAQLLSYLATFLGPMLTAPWWYEQWEKRRARKDANGLAAQPAEKPGHYIPE